MKASEIRQSFLDFFRGKQHTIVPSASLLPNTPNLLFTNAGMNQFVPYFLGQERPAFTPPRAADTQKCIRAGGKHNDLDDVGFDTYHHTFFEMLGNWSFGDYFKKEAIEWAWELLVQHWKFPPERLYATVYKPGVDDPAEFDEEACKYWTAAFAEAGLDPKIHVVNGNRKDNFWMMGDTGPCGPCSEIHVDLTAGGDTQGRLVNQGNALCMEIWNLVFIQLNANADGGFSPLPARHVDTGLGFERVAGIIECTGGFRDFSGRISNYQSDVFRPIFQKISGLSGKSYRNTVPDSRSNLSEQEKVDIAFRVVADHIRTLSFAITDGIIPGNTDRNYVLRRILRRAIMFGRHLGFGSNGFLSKLVPTIVDKFGSTFPELTTQKEHVMDVLDREETLFNHTLDRGLRMFEEEYNKRTSHIFPAEAAFRLYDTYGFPLDLTEVLARERGLSLDLGSVEKMMEEQRQRSRAAQEKEVVTAVEETVTTEFVGFDHDEAKAQLVEIIGREKQTFAIVDRSPLYAEMGGQVSDTGELVFQDNKITPVQGVTKQGRTFYLKLAGPLDVNTPAEVLLRVNGPRRRMIEAHHTATHLLHWALHEVVSKEVSQKGSFVGPEHLRFDFNSRPITPQQLRDIEELINGRIVANDQVSWVEVPYGEVQLRNDIMQFFGEKYGATVRVVQIGGNPGELDGYSMELCGGTHVLRTGQLGVFKIVSEGAISAGVRRLEALSGLVAFRHLQTQLDQRSMKIEQLNRELLDLKKELEKERAEILQREAEEVVAKLSAAERVLVHAIDGATADQLQSVANLLKRKGFAGIAVLFGKGAEQIQFLVIVDPSLIGRIQAGKIVQELAGILGGKGGGRPEMARGVGKDTAKLDLAKERVLELTAGI
ncbi:MAG: alanine--tRNA ligase [Verrucomicrobia bacterium]|nr:alanine--tRNA ligase [Verrucomicrobiota bacterium]MBV9645771.1 alanine--tRNA ligase [Verrucomicrobiota bacterium]